MKISIIMNCLNCTRYLREAIDSVYGQTYSNWEIILWDNASQEDVRGILGEYDDRLRYFRGKKTVKLGEARNLAVGEAKGDFIAFLDCDDLWLPEKLKLQIGRFDDPEVGLVYSDWLLFNDRGHQREKYGSRSAPQGWVFEQVLFNNFTCLSTIMVRAEVVHSTGIVFDPQFTYIEDTDFITRIARNWKFAYEAQVLTKYRMHGGSASATREEEFRDEEELLVEKYCGLFTDFSSKYAPKMRRGICKDRAVTLWRKGFRRQAMGMLLPQLLCQWRYPLIFLVMFIPYPWVDWVRKRLSGTATGYYY